MPAILEAVRDHPPRRFVLQTRGPLILRDLDLLRTVATVRVSFTIATDREEIRRLYEPHCAPYEERLAVVRALRHAGIETYVTLAPLLPCDPEELARAAIEASGRDLIGDPLHVRSVKPRGATTREAAFRIAQVQGHHAWLDPEYQASVVERIASTAAAMGRRFATGPRGFSILTS
jgi:DNA repair photolyase